MIDTCWYKDVCTVEDCKDSCIRYQEVKYLMDKSGIPLLRQFPPRLYPDGEDYTQYCLLNEQKSRIVDFVNNGESLYICSTVTGNGKTTWAIKLMLKYFDEVWAGNGFRVRGVFIHTPTFLSRLKAFNEADPDFDELKHCLPTVDLVIWDDIASSALSGYDYSQLLSYIDCRILEGKSNIFTGNLVTYDSLEKTLGTRLTSRIWNGSRVVIFNGKDRRG